MDIAIIRNVLFVVINEILLFFLVICIQTFFYSKTIGVRMECNRLRLVLVMFIVAIIQTTLQLAALNTAFGFWLVPFVLIIYILYPIFFMGGKLKEQILFGIVNCVIVLFASLLSFIIIFQNNSDMTWTTMLLFGAIFITINSVLTLIIIHFNMEGKRYMPRKYWSGMIICFSVICIGLIMAQLSKILFVLTDRLRMYLTIFWLGFLVIWLLSYFVFYFVCRFFSKTVEANLLAYEKDMIEKFILQKQASEKRIQILSHDLKHCLVNWRLMVEEKGDTSVLQNILEYEEQLSSSLLINVANETANAIINQKCLEAQLVQIEFLVDGVFYNDLLMSKQDICSLLGNLLDNAIEASAKVETVSLRKVKLSIKRKSNILILVVENGYAVEPIIVNGVFVTSKKDKNHHAIGMLSIHCVADKYDGTVNNTFENNWFKSIVMLSGYQNLLSDKKINIQTKTYTEC